MSEASRAAPSSSPRTRGVEPAGGHDGVGLVGVHHRDGEGAPRRARRPPGSPRPAQGPAAMCSSMRWAITSVSVAEVMMWPSATSSARARRGSR